MFKHTHSYIHTSIEGGWAEVKSLSLVFKSCSNSLLHIVTEASYLHNSDGQADYACIFHRLFISEKEKVSPLDNLAVKREGQQL